MACTEDVVFVEYIADGWICRVTAAGHWIAVSWDEGGRQHPAVDGSSVDDCRRRLSCCRDISRRRRHQCRRRLVHGTPPCHQLNPLPRWIAGCVPWTRVLQRFDLRWLGTSKLSARKMQELKTGDRSGCDMILSVCHWVCGFEFSEHVRAVTWVCTL